MAIPRAVSSPISLARAQGSMTMPGPITHRIPGWRMPEGMRCSTKVWSPMRMVWPAL